MAVYKNTKNESYFVKFNYRDFYGNIRQKKKEGFKSREEAKTYEVDFITNYSPNTDMKYKDFFLLYMKDCKIRLKPTSYNTKKYIFNKNILPFFGEIYLSEINLNYIRKWQNILLKGEKSYSLIYLQTVHNQFSASLNFACKYHGLQKNYAKLAGSVGQKYSNIVNFWTLKEYKQFIKYVENDLDKLAFQLLFWTGIRIGELLALKMSDFNFEHNNLYISRNYARLHGEDLFLPTKTPASNRNISIPNFLSLDIKRYFNLKGNLYTERIFSFSKYHLYGCMKKICALSGVKRIRIHDLRHSHASLLLELNFSPSVIAARLGHESIMTTMRIYSHLYPDVNMKIADKLNKLMK